MASHCTFRGVAVSSPSAAQKKPSRSVTLGLLPQRRPSPSAQPQTWERRCKRKVLLHARKKGQVDDVDDAKALGEWADLCKDPTDNQQLEPDTQLKLNKICTKGLKLMLKGSSLREIEDYQDKVSELGASYSNKQDMQGATFAYALYKMTEHVAVKEADNLQGEYRVAYVRMLAMLEDSGWSVKKEGEEDSDDPDDPLPNVPTVGSYNGTI